MPSKMTPSLKRRPRASSQPTWPSPTFISSPSTAVLTGQTSFRNVAHLRKSRHATSTLSPSTPSFFRARVPRMTVQEDPVAKRVRDELAADGVNLDELLNAGKVVNLTRKLDTLALESSVLAEGTPELQQLQEKVAKIERDLVREKRQVMQAWLKNLFLFQAILFIVIGGMLSNDIVPGVSVPLVGQALGFWTTWLFTIPSLRARKGTSAAEKSALNVAFLATPFLNLALPPITKNCGLIWGADLVVLAGCYLYYGIKSVNEAESEQLEKGVVKEQARVKGILRYLDWGSWR